MQKLDVDDPGGGGVAMYMYKRCALHTSYYGGSEDMPPPPPGQENFEFRPSEIPSGTYKHYVLCFMCCVVLCLP